MAVYVGNDTRTYKDLRFNTKMNINIGSSKGFTTWIIVLIIIFSLLSLIAFI